VVDYRKQSAVQLLNPCCHLGDTALQAREQSLVYSLPTDTTLIACGLLKPKVDRFQFVSVNSEARLN